MASREPLVEAAEIIAAALDRQTEAMREGNALYHEDRERDRELNLRMYEFHREVDERQRKREAEFDEWDRAKYLEWLSKQPDFVRAAVAQLVSHLKGDKTDAKTGE